MNWLVEPWMWGSFMWRAALACTLVSLICVPAGVVLFLRRQSLMADAMSHVVLPGIVVAYLLFDSVSPAVLLPGAVVAGIVAAAAIARLERVKTIRPDAAMAIVFSTFFAGGVILLSTQARHAHIDTDCVLFGNVLGISNDTLWTLGLGVLLIFAFFAIFWRWLSVATFDVSFATGIGVPVVALHYALMSSVSIATVASFEAVGAVLVIAFFVIPATTAHMVTRRLITMMFAALGFAWLSAVVGLYASVYLNCSTAGAIVVSQGLIYGLTMAVSSAMPHLRTR
jgi:manganese/zinc/iron transport system permease protein